MEKDKSLAPLGLSPTEYLERYNVTTIRQIVLIYSAQEFADILPHFKTIRNYARLKNNTDVVTMLVHMYINQLAKTPKPKRKRGSTVEPEQLKLV